ncbi:MAG: pilus assembly protein PilP [Deltaproteobacteria bacterium]|nr:pilus assembly protein PilP [Deltaproteobacteria bacterium]
MDGIKKLIIFLIIIIFILPVLSSKAQESEKTDIVNTPVLSQEKPLYRPQGNRDPFKPFIKIVEQKEAKSEVSTLLPPIKRYSLDQYRLVGILWSEQQPKAMIVDPERNTYVLGIGDEIGNSQGRVIEVRDNGILVEERRQLEDVFGQKKIETRKSILAFREE